MSQLGDIVGRDEVTSEESVGSITVNPLYEHSRDEAQGSEHPARRTRSATPSGGRRTRSPNETFGTLRHPSNPSILTRRSHTGKTIVSPRIAGLQQRLTAVTGAVTERVETTAQSVASTQRTADAALREAREASAHTAQVQSAVQAALQDHFVTTSAVTKSQLDGVAKQMTQHINQLVSQRQHASDIAYQTELATVRNELAQLRMANEATASQSQAVESRTASQAQEQYLQLQDELAVERAKRQHAERLWTEQMDQAQGSAMQVQTRTAVLES